MVRRGAVPVPLARRRVHHVSGMHLRALFVARLDETPVSYAPAAGHPALRREIAALTNSDPESVIVTTGASEAMSILFCLCDADAVAPAETALRYAATAPRGEVKRYPVGHFDIYLGEPFEHAVGDQTEFLVRHLEVA